MSDFFTNVRNFLIFYYFKLVGNFLDIFFVFNYNSKAGLISVFCFDCAVLDLPNSLCTISSTG